jgi:hypothetical protein
MKNLFTQVKEVRDESVPTPDNQAPELRHCTQCVFEKLGRRVITIDEDGYASFRRWLLFHHCGLLLCLNSPRKAGKLFC